MRHNCLKIILAAALLAAFNLPSLSLSAQWGGGITMGYALPAGSSDNAPELRPSFSSTLRIHYTLPSRLSLFVETGNVRHLSFDSPDYMATPMDTVFHVYKYLFFPFLAGASYEIPATDILFVRLYGALGGSFHSINTHRQTAVLQTEEYEESSVGIAARFGVDLMFWSRLSIGVNYLILGRPARHASDPIPGSDIKLTTTNTVTDISLDGYWQSFASFNIGFWL